MTDLEIWHHQNKTWASEKYARPCWMERVACPWCLTKLDPRLVCAFHATWWNIRIGKLKYWLLEKLK